MKNALIIAKRDFRSYFTSPIAYIVISAFLAIMGVMYFNILAWYIEQSRQFNQFGGGPKMTVARGVISPLFQNMNVVLLFLLPFVTMRLFSEERKNHTIELLMTSPIALSELVLGKFLSSLFLLLVMLAVTAVYPVVTFMTAETEWGPVLTSYLGTFLMAGSFLSLGVLFSATTENQIVAGALTFASALFFWMLSWFVNSTGPVIGEFLGQLSLINHYNGFSQGMIDTADLVYFVSFIGVGLFLTYRVLDSYRWRSS